MTHNQWVPADDRPQGNMTHRQWVPADNRQQGAPYRGQPQSPRVSLPSRSPAEEMGYAFQKRDKDRSSKKGSKVASESLSTPGSSSDSSEDDRHKKKFRKSRKSSVTDATLAKLTNAQQETAVFMKQIATMMAQQQGKAIADQPLEEEPHQYAAHVKAHTPLFAPASGYWAKTTPTALAGASDSHAYAPVLNRTEMQELTYSEVNGADSEALLSKEERPSAAMLNLIAQRDMLLQGYQKTHAALDCMAHYATSQQEEVARCHDLIKKYGHKMSTEDNIRFPKFKAEELLTPYAAPNVAEFLAVCHCPLDKDTTYGTICDTVESLDLSFPAIIKRIQTKHRAVKKYR